jgi:hypothetical protein
MDVDSTAVVASKASAPSATGEANLSPATRGQGHRFPNPKATDAASSPSLSPVLAANLSVPSDGNAAQSIFF